MRNSSEQSFFIRPTIAEEVLSEIKNLKNNRSTGPSSSIPTKFLKLFQISLSEPISLMIANTCFSIGNFPFAVKIANVIPIFKKNYRILSNNYRPNSLLSNISKFIKKLIHVRLTTFLNANKTFYEKQFGFRHNHSTTHARFEITEKIKQACDSGQYACGVFRDLQKAFDTVNDDILKKKNNNNNKKTKKKKQQQQPLWNQGNS